MTRNEILSRVAAKHGQKYSYPDSPDNVLSTDKIQIFCSKHGHFKQRLTNHLAGVGCPKCNNSFYKTQEEFVAELVSSVGNKYDLSMIRYKNSYTPVVIICGNHGPFKRRPTAILELLKTSDCLCPKCNGREVDSTESFIEKAARIHGDKYDYSKSIYKNARIKVEIICPKHGSFFQTPDDHYNSHGCRKCSLGGTSIAEEEWINSLKNPNIKRRVSIKCGNRRFFVDGYDPTTNTIYEFNGDYFHGNPKYFCGTEINKFCKTYHGHLYSKTLEKERMLLNSGYNVISIWESDYKESLGKPYSVKKRNKNLDFQSKVALMKKCESQDPLSDYSFLLKMP